MFVESFISFFFRGSRLWRCTKGLVTKSHVFRLLPGYLPGVSWLFKI